MIRKIIVMMIGFITVGNVSASCRAAIAETTPTSNFEVSASDEVVIDKTTGLMWKRCLEGYSGTDCKTGDAIQATYVTALQNIASINSGSGFAGFTDWRMPNIKELRSIVEEQCNGLALNEDVFPYEDDGTAEDDIRLQFSNTPRPYREADATWVLGVDFDDGAIVPFSVGSVETDSASLVGSYRLVRNAQ
ncbi:DUF1566 domain-containing protein [Marinomonas mediterranea]|uniref:Lcl C-terminal domain-containing protein n=1 Tax=Marinomonas mediterranea TaxID=119864 RepID=UPI002349BC70|nr:DUF1566 domain-containing protein [Marinomonas mediterranea]WCN14842.1 DUF1566 domain-containing protein [Marinomonas mediterranea]